MSRHDLNLEQEYVRGLYRRLDELTLRTADGLVQVLHEPTAAGRARADREARAARYRDRLTRLHSAQDRLCFGRLDLADGERRYVGRIGLTDERTGERVLLDWRAPAARPFYLATALTPLGVVRRRHLHCRGRVVVRVDDELLDRREATGSGPALTGEAALLAALDASRTGRMGDVVATIQAEQDRIIRAPAEGVLVVQGGPGTGKTAVALHRAAYLLFDRREILSRRGVLVVGPTTTFLGYIRQVLPSLGETAVLLATVADLFPGVVATATEPAAVSWLKGRPELAGVLAAAVRDRRRVPDEGLAVPHEGFVLRLDAPTCRRLRDRALDAGLPHNPARPGFVGSVLDALTREYADQLGADPFGGQNLLAEADLVDLRAELVESAQVRSAIDALWPALTPQQLLEDLFAAPERLAAAAPELSPQERELLHRPPGHGWTPADVPLLDEAAELLGEDDRARRERAGRRWRGEVAYAQGVLDVAFGSRSTDLEDDEAAETVSAFDLVDARALAGRHDDVDDRSLPERAAADRRWTFGHVIVDEAQELSAMAWRMLARRCPTRSMTLVGDTAQTGDPAGTRSWTDLLDRQLPGRRRLVELTLNYRVPGEAMAVAAQVLHRIDPAARPPRSVRQAGTPACSLHLPDLDEPGGPLPALLRELLPGLAERRLAVIVPRQRLGSWARAVADAVPGARVGEDPDDPAPVVLLDPAQAKGLEFDVVLVTEPDLVLTGSDHGDSDLYVALTRATQRLAVLHPRPLPAWLTGLRAVRRDELAAALRISSAGQG